MDRDFLVDLGSLERKTKRILEVNPSHAVLRKLLEVYRQDSQAPEVGDFARLLHGQAVLAEGGKLEDPSAFSKLLTDLMVKSI